MSQPDDLNQDKQESLADKLHKITQNIKRELHEVIMSDMDKQKSVSIWKWIDGDNGRFRAWFWGAFCGSVLGLLVSLSLLVFPIFEKGACK